LRTKFNSIHKTTDTKGFKVMVKYKKYCIQYTIGCIFIVSILYKKTAVEYFVIQKAIEIVISIRAPQHL
jgi:hypothetical protein